MEVGKSSQLRNCGFGSFHNQRCAHFLKFPIHISPWQQLTKKKLGTKKIKSSNMVEKYFSVTWFPYLYDKKIWMPKLSKSSTPQDHEDILRFHWFRSTSETDYTSLNSLLRWQFSSYPHHDYSTIVTIVSYSTEFKKQWNIVKEIPGKW